MLSLGIDHDAGRWKVAAWDEQAAAVLRALRAAGEVWEVVDELLALHPAAPIVLPSGLGVPLTRAADLMDQDIAEIALDLDGRAADDLGAFLVEARRRALRAFCIPAVKLLPSVPIHRKVNRLDLGSAGALCAAAWIIHAATAQGSGSAFCGWVLVHATHAGTCLLAIRAGRIVDGTGNLAPDTGRISGRTLEALLRRTAHPGSARPRVRSSWPPGTLVEAEREMLAQAALGLLRFHDLPHAVVIGDRRAEAEHLLGGCVPLATSPAVGAGFEAALGAAVIAAGLTGGPSAGLVQHLGLREVRERALDWLAPQPPAEDGGAETLPLRG
jgi:predicted butyrate kinase (DUF1464 family)